MPVHLVPVCTWYIHVCTNCMTCTFFRGCTCVEMLGYHNIHVPHAQYSFPQSKVNNMSSLQIFGKTLYSPVCTSMYQVCTSTYSFRSHSHFIFNQARPSLRRPRVSFLRTSNALRAASCLSKVSSIVRPPRRGLPRPNLNPVEHQYKHVIYWYVRVCTCIYIVN